MWREFIIILFLAIATYAVTVSTKLEPSRSILMFTALFSVVLLITLFGLQKIKEQFWMETPPKYKKCYPGAYGRPLSFAYDLPEVEEKCNPF